MQTGIFFFLHCRYTHTHTEHTHQTQTHTNTLWTAVPGDHSWMLTPFFQQCFISWFIGARVAPGNAGRASCVSSDVCRLLFYSPSCQSCHKVELYMTSCAFEIWGKWKYRLPPWNSCWSVLLQGAFEFVTRSLELKRAADDRWVKSLLYCHWMLIRLYFKLCVCVHRYAPNSLRRLIQ